MSYQTIIPLKTLSHSNPFGPYTLRFPNRPGCGGCDGRVATSAYTYNVPLSIPTSETRIAMEDESTFSRQMPVDGSWRDIVKSGAIKMTPGFVRNARTNYHLSTLVRNDYHFVQLVSYASCCGQIVWGDPDLHTIDEHISWAEQGDFLYWSEKYNHLPTLPSPIDDDVFTARIERAKTSVWSDLIRQYDLGAELGELHETIQFGLSILKAARNPLQTLSRIRKAKPNDFANAWMSYRYALMPLIYSARDIFDLIAQKDNLFKTVRMSFDAEIRNPDIPEESCFYTVINGGITAHITAKGSWNTSDLKMIGQIGLNPLTTAWELTSLSFVVDWFINFGDYLNAVSGTWASLANQLAGCTSVRTNTERNTFLRLVLDERKQFIAGTPPTSFPYIEVNRGERRVVDIPLITQVDNSYERSLFDETDLKVVLSPYLNWKRLIDGSIISIRSLQSVLRKLR